jgi:hypothetical protein
MIYTTRLFAKTILAICIVAMFGVAYGVEAVSISFSSSIQTSLPGKSVNFSGSIENAGSQTVFLNGDNVTLFDPGITSDDTAFLTSAPLSLGPGQLWTGPFFQLTIDPTTFPGTYDGTFTLYGGTSSSTFDIIGSGSFQEIVKAPAAVPEFSSTFVLLLIGLLAIAIVVVSLRSRKVTLR